MDQIDLLQSLLGLFPESSEPLDSLVPIERELKNRLDVTKAFLLSRRHQGFTTLNGELLIPTTDSLFRSLVRSRRQYLPAKPRQAGWSGFWPLGTKGDWTSCWALGPKMSWGKISAGEMKLMAILADRTALFLENRELWTRLENAGRQASLGLMSAAMAHEIRNPLTALSTLIQLLPQKGKDPVFLESFQKMTQREIDRLTELTGSFLDLAKPSPEKSKKFDLAVLLEQVGNLMEPLLQTKGVKLSIRPAKGLFLNGNERQIESLVLNLVQNAYRSIGKDGRILVSSRRVSVPKDLGPGSWLEIRVKDNGRGIAPENLEKVFSPFFTTEEEGTGLGLAICQKVVEFHGGLLKVKSVPQKGALFTVLLPALK